MAPRRRTTLPQICNEIQFEIIRFLPVRYVMQCTLLSRFHRSEIQSSYFAGAYRSLPNLPPHLMLRYEDLEEDAQMHFLSFVDDDNIPPLHFTVNAHDIFQRVYQPLINDSSRGLLYVTALYRPQPQNAESEIAVLWNPSIRRAVGVVVPRPWHPALTSVTGFWVCPRTNDPKLVTFTYIDDRHGGGGIARNVRVFTLSVGVWEISPTSLPRESIRFDERFQRVIGHHIYWVACDRVVGVDGTYDFSRSLLMSYDFTNGVFREIELPDPLQHDPISLAIFKLNGSLAVVEYTEDGPLMRNIAVWRMEDGNPITFFRLYDIVAPGEFVSEVVGFTNIGKPILEVYEDENQVSCVPAVYDSLTEQFTRLEVQGSARSFFVGSFIESLLLVNEDGSRII